MGEEEDPKAKKDEESGVCSALAAWHAAAGAPRLPCRRLHQRGAAADGSPSPLGSQPVRKSGAADKPLLCAHVRPCVRFCYRAHCVAPRPGLMVRCDAVQRMRTTSRSPQRRTRARRRRMMMMTPRRRAATKREGGGIGGLGSAVGGKCPLSNITLLHGPSFMICGKGGEREVREGVEGGTHVAARPTGQGPKEARREEEHRSCESQGRCHRRCDP